LSALKILWDFGVVCLNSPAFANDGEEVDCFISALSGVTRDFVRALDLTVYSMEKTSELLSGVMS
jgi:hypothetical protein